MLDLLPADCGIERKFAMHYAQYTNARQAAIFCGYPPETAGRAGARLLKTKKVLRELAALNVKTQRESVGDIEEARKFWTAVMRGEREDIPEQFLLDGDGNPLPPHEAALVRWKFQHDMGDRIKCSELLGKSLGAFIERIEERKTLQSIERIIERRIVHVTEDGREIKPDKV